MAFEDIDYPGGADPRQELGRVVAAGADDRREENAMNRNARNKMFDLVRLFFIFVVGFLTSSFVVRVTLESGGTLLEAIFLGGVASVVMGLMLGISILGTAGEWHE